MNAVDEVKGSPVAVDHTTCITSSSGSSLTLETAGKVDDNGTFLCFSSNDYLGLSCRQSIITAAKSSIDLYGLSTNNSRVYYGYMKVHRDLEAAIANFHCKEDALVFHSGLDVNLSLFAGIVTPNDIIFSDKLNHASIILAMQLCKATKIIYNHIDMTDLAEKMEKADCTGRKIIITDGVFSMDGDVAPLKELHSLAEEHDALLYVDDAHGIGCLGDTGRGTEEHFGLMGKRNIIITASMGKALGTSGGYVAGNKDVIREIVTKSPLVAYSNGASPAAAGSTLQAILELSRNPSFSEKLRRNAKKFREMLTKAGFHVKGFPEHPICPLVFKHLSQVEDICRKLKKHGILVMGIGYPFVPKDVPRVRLSVSLKHSEEDMERVVGALTEICHSSTEKPSSYEQ